MPPVIPDAKRIRSFATAESFEAWLSQHHDRESELWLRVYKKGSQIATVTAAQAIEVALCWGWIDGLRKGLDEESFLQRFTPRRSKSVWSQINQKTVERLVAAGRMTPHGQRQVDAAKADGRWAAAYAPISATSLASLPADLHAAIEADPKARLTLAELTRQNLFALVAEMSRVKTSAGRARKIEQLVAALARKEPPLPGGVRPKPIATTRKAAPSPKTTAHKKTPGQRPLSKRTNKNSAS